MITLKIIHAQHGWIPLRLIIASAIGVIIFLSIIWWVDINQIAEAMLKASPLWVAASFLLYLATFPIRAVRWKLILTASSKSRVKVSTAFWVTNLGSFVNTVVPLRLGGEFARAVVIDRHSRTGFFQSLSSIAVERLLDLLAIVSMAVLALYVSPPVQESLVVFVNFASGIGILTIAALIILFLGARRPQSIIGVLTRLLRDIFRLKESWKNRILDTMRSLLEGTKMLSGDRKILVVVLLLSWTIWILGFLSIQTLFISLDYDVPLGVVLIGSMLIFLSFIFPAPPGYVGTFEAYWSLIFLGLGLMHANIILAIALLNHIITIIATLGLGSLSVAWLGVSFSDILRVKNMGRPTNT